MDGALRDHTCYTEAPSSVIARSPAPLAGGAVRFDGLTLASAVGNSAMGRLLTRDGGRLRSATLVSRPRALGRVTTEPSGSSACACDGMVVEGGECSRCLTRQSDAQRMLRAAIMTRRGVVGRVVQRRELSAPERARVAELEQQAARLDLNAEQLTALNNERNAIITGSGMTSRREAERPGNTSTAAPVPPSGDRPPLQLPVGVDYELVSFVDAPAAAPLVPVTPNAISAPPPLAPIAQNPALGAGPLSEEDYSWLAAVTSGGLGATGRSALGVLDPLPGNLAIGQANVYTRFAGRGLQPLNPELYPRLFQGGDMSRFAPYEAQGIRYAQLSELYRALRRPGGVAALTAEQRQLLATVTRLHAVEGAVEGSPLISLTELVPDEALARLPPVATQRTYIVRVRIHPNDVVRVNETLGQAGRTERLVTELEVVVSRDLRGIPGTAGRTEIVSIRANPAPSAALGGRLGTALRWGGRAMVVVGLAITSAEILTAQGPHRREQQGRSAGGFIGGVYGGAFAVGFCVGAGIATGGAVLALCGLVGGGLGMLGGAAAGGAIGSAAD